MKTIFACSFMILFLLNVNRASAQNSPLDMQFRFRDHSGALHDTIVTWLMYHFWVQSDNYPAYVKWKNQPFAILKVGKHNAALFTDSLTGYSSGDIVGLAFFKRGNTGRFDIDYVKTNVCSFVNHAEKPNMEIVSTAKGLFFRAKNKIGPNTELTVNYGEIKTIAGADPSANKMLAK